MTEREILEMPEYIRDATLLYIKRRKYAVSHPEYTLTDCDYVDYQTDINNAEVNDMISSKEAWRLRDEVLNGTYDKDRERNDRYDKDSFCDGITDEEKMQHHRDHMAELEQEQALDPVTLDRGDPYRNVRDDDQNGQYDYMEEDKDR